MKKVAFVTGNARKLKEAQSACQPHGITVDQLSVHIDEIQSHDAEEISMHKAVSAYEQVNEPIVINDTFWQIPALNGFPGGYMKDVATWFKPEDFLNLMRDKTDRTAIITECIVYKDHHTTMKFSKDYLLTIAHESRGVGNSIEKVAIYKGKTLAEYHEAKQLPIQPDEHAWNDFAEWFKTYQSLN